VTTSVGGYAAPRRKKGADNVIWANMNLIRPKNKENQLDQFNYFKWTMKI
jgi:hypothetical protein